MPRNKKKLLKVLGNLQDKIIQVCSPSLIFFFIQFVSLLPLICLNILLGLTFVYECGCGILIQVGFWVCFLKWSFVGGWGWFYFDFLGDNFLLRGLFVYLFFLCFVVELF